MAERVNLPCGFRFCPSDQELITGYLKPKILGQKLVCDVINDIDLYGPNSTPWQLFDVNDDSWTSSHENFTEKYLYVFTTLSKVSESPKQKQKRIRQNTCKTAGCGTWVAKTKKKTIKDRMDNVIGHQRMLLFAIKDTGPQFDFSKAGHFRMHEFTLGGINKGLKSAGGDIVLCKITFDSSKDPICKDQNMELNNEEKVERIVGNNLEETRNDILTSVVAMNSTAGDNLANTSESLFVMDSGNGDSNNSLADTDQFDNGSQDFGWDPSFTDWFMGLLTSDQEQGTFEDINKLDNTSSNRGKGQNMELNNNEEKVERIIGNNLEETRNETLTSVVEMNSTAGDNLADTSESLFVMDSGNGDSYNSLAVTDQFDNGSQDFGWDPSFTDWFMGLLTSDQEQGALEDINKLGKRKFEEENLYSSKKICL